MAPLRLVKRKTDVVLHSKFSTAVRPERRVTCGMGKMPTCGDEVAEGTAMRAAEEAAERSVIAAAAADVVLSLVMPASSAMARETYISRASP